MNQTAGVSNHVRCSSKGSKVRPAGVRHLGERGWLGCLAAGMPGPRPPVPKPTAESVSPLRSPLAHHLAKFSISAAARAVEPPPRRVLARDGSDGALDGSRSLRARVTPSGCDPGCWTGSSGRCGLSIQCWNS